MSVPDAWPAGIVGDRSVWLPAAQSTNCYGKGCNSPPSNFRGRRHHGGTCGTSTPTWGCKKAYWHPRTRALSSRCTGVPPECRRTLRCITAGGSCCRFEDLCSCTLAADQCAEHLAPAIHIMTSQPSYIMSKKAVSGRWRYREYPLVENASTNGGVNFLVLVIIFER